MKRSVHLSDGDVDKLVWDPEVDRLLIYDRNWGDPLIQAKLTREERELFIAALGGLPVRSDT